MVAEMASAFVCASLGIVPTVRHADYLGAWLDILREDNRGDHPRRSAASKAADYLLAFLPETPYAAGARAAQQPQSERAEGVFVTGLKAGREASGWPVRRPDMAAANPKIVLSRSQDIPFNKLVLSQANVRRVKAGISIEELAEDIAHRGLLHGLSVRPVLDADGAETGMFEVPAGGRRFRALELLVKQKRMAKTEPVPCVVRTEGLAAEDLLAENVHRAPLHPLDQFRAFQTLREQGLGEEEIAARFFISPDGRHTAAEARLASRRSSSTSMPRTR